ncbi:MAG: tRNA pseudouridine(54/55) synthase Pus10 [Thermoplasmatota archaeon]
MDDFKWIDMNAADILGKAHIALKYPICDHCLGRFFAKSGYGLSNDERGRSLRIVLALTVENDPGDSEIPDEDISRRIPVHVNTNTLKEKPDTNNIEPDEWIRTDGLSMELPWKEVSFDEDRCWLCEDVFDRIEDLVNKVITAARDLQFDTFMIGTSLDPSMIHREEILLGIVEPKAAEPLKEEINRLVGKRLQEVWPESEVDKTDPEVTFIIDPIFRTIKTQIKPLFIYARYRKMVRGIPQTRWPCKRCRGRGCEKCGGKGRMYEISVEELIGQVVMEMAKGTNFKLHGKGREDVDVRTLGRGRPFVLEISQPSIRKLDIDLIQDIVNQKCADKVQITDARWALRKDISWVKEAGGRKRYRATVRISGDLDEEKLKYGISLLSRSLIHQRTPVRVVHRRSDKIRDRKVHEAAYKILSDGNVEVDVLADGGLYIKELMHGDDGRTDPSLSSLLERTIEVVNLDVLDVLDDDEELNG